MDELRVDSLKPDVTIKNEIFARAYVRVPRKVASVPLSEGVGAYEFF